MPDAPVPDLPAAAADLRLAVKLLAHRLRTEARPGLSWSQESAISLLDRKGSVTVSELAKAEGVRSQSMGSTVAGLAAEGLVRREPDPSDGRQTLVSLTEQGQESLARTREAKQTWVESVIAERLTTDEQRTLVSAVELLLRLV
ncbi:MarR family winged helix-turn-helix transcriptional regulator [Streptomyces sp. NPDC054770]